MEHGVSQERELGREIARLRDLAGLTQAELAQRLDVSQAVVSRIESGDRILADEELRSLVNAVGSEDAKAIEGRLAREWCVLARPPLGHPDHDLLWDAEMAGRELVALLNRPDIAQAFAHRIDDLLGDIRSTAQQLLRRACDVVFIGKVGVGKTSAICRIGGLVVPRPRGPGDVAVLDVAGGRTTLCEVRIRTGQTGIAIEPCTDTEVRAYVAEFADKIIDGLDDVHGGQRNRDTDDRSLAIEVEKAIRNISGLVRPSGKDAEGRRLPDPAKELAREILANGPDCDLADAAQRLQFEILSRMTVGKRDRRDIYFDPSSGMSPLPWLKSEFHRINIGANPEFTIPKRINVSVDIPLIAGTAGVDICIVDTKGIDETVARADLEGHFGSSHTVIVLCSGFNDAPCKEAVDLLRRADEVGVETKALHGMLLGLPKYDEALQMRDDSGEPVDSVEDGYDLKARIVEEVLHDELEVKGFSVQFFNSHQDDVEQVRQELAERVAAVFDGCRSTMSDLVQGAHTLVENFADEQVQEVVRQVSTLVRNWATNNERVGTVLESMEADLMAALNATHPSTIHATMRRRGTWYNLEYAHHLEYGARVVVSAMLRRKVEMFEELCKTILTNPDNEPARPVLDQAHRALKKAYGNLTHRSRLLGETWFHNELEPAEQLWAGCIQRWGRGEGYVKDVSEMNEEWFDDHPEPNEQLTAMVAREWRSAMRLVVDMLTQG